MDLRRLLFKLMLWSLGAAAVAGVLAMLTASYDVAARIAGTALLTSVAAGVLWKLEPNVCEPAARSAALLGMVVTIVCYLLALPALWDIGPEEELWLTALGTAVTGATAVGSLRLWPSAKAAVAARAGLICSGGVWLLWMVPTWLVDGRSDSDWWETVLAVGIYAALMTICLIDVEPSARGLWRWAGAGCAIGACGVLLHEIWSSGVDHFKLITVLTSATAVAVHANLAGQVPLGGPYRWIRVGTIAAGVFTALGVDFLIVGELTGDNFVARLSGAAAIVTGCGSLALVVLSRLNREPTELPSLSALTEIKLICPRCQRRQTVPLGAAVCPRCGTRISVSIKDGGCEDSDPAAMRSQEFSVVSSV